VVNVAGQQLVFTKDVAIAQHVLQKAPISAYIKPVDESGVLSEVRQGISLQTEISDI
jgi:uncharacterized protein HemX